MRKIACYLRYAAAVVLLCAVLAIIDPAQITNALWPLGLIPNACCCDTEELSSGSSSTSYPGCSCCIGDYDGQFDVEIFGVADQICIECESLNGLYTLSFMGGYLDGVNDEQVISSQSGFPPGTSCASLPFTTCCRAWGHWFRWGCGGSQPIADIHIGLNIYKFNTDNSSSSSGSVGSDIGDCTIQVFFSVPSRPLFGTFIFSKRLNADEVDCALIHGLELSLQTETGTDCNGSAARAVVSAVVSSQSS
jgi:hypothetical protein